MTAKKYLLIHKSTRGTRSRLRAQLILASVLESPLHRSCILPPASWHRPGEATPHVSY
jgi:hypothetical protein